MLLPLDYEDIREKERMRMLKIEKVKDRRF